MENFCKHLRTTGGRNFDFLQMRFFYVSSINTVHALLAVTEHR